MPISAGSSTTVSGTGIATAVKQDDQTTLLTAIRDYVDTVEPLLTTIRDNADTLEASFATLNAKDFATQTTLAAVLAKIITAPATEAKQDTANTSLSDIAGYTDGLETLLATIRDNATTYEANRNADDDALRGLVATEATSQQLRDRNAEGTLLASAARTATTSSPDQTNLNARGVLVSLNITATPNTAETLTVSIEAKDPVSGNYRALTAFAVTSTGLVLGAAPAAPTGLFDYEIYPGAVETANAPNLETQRLALPRTWRVSVTPSGSGSWTYSLGYAVIV